MALPNAQTIKEIIKGDTKKLVQEAERMGEHFRNLKAKRKELTTSQIRNVFGSVKKMEMKGFGFAVPLNIANKLTDRLSWISFSKMTRIFEQASGIFGIEKKFF